MKPAKDRRLKAILFLAFAAMSCSKIAVDDLSLAPKKSKESKCEITGIQLTYPSIPTRSLFSSVMSASGKEISSIAVGLYSGGGIVDTAKLNLSYGKDVIYMLSTSSPQDTTLKLVLNRTGRVILAGAGSPFMENQSFYYDSMGRLSLIVLGNNFLRFWFRYDSYGNNTEIVSDSTDGIPRIHHQYSYDHSRSIPKQIYQDEPRGYSMDVFTILHAAGFFPEVDGVHARTRTTVYWGPYRAGDYDLSEHQVVNGRLMQYSVRYHGYPASTPITYNINYSCRGNESEQ